LALSERREKEITSPELEKGGGGGGEEERGKKTRERSRSSSGDPWEGNSVREVLT